VFVVPFVVEVERWFHGCHTKSAIASSTTTMTAMRIGVLLLAEDEESRSTIDDCLSASAM
jgi:hypothetical protein